MFTSLVYKIVDNLDSHICAPFICINTQIQKVGCGVPIESTPWHNRCKIRAEGRGTGCRGAGRDRDTRWDGSSEEN